MKAKVLNAGIDECSKHANLQISKLQPGPARFIKKARFLPEFRAKNGSKSAVMVTINEKLVTIIYYYHNHRFSNTLKFTINHIRLMINDLKHGPFEVDNFSLVQGCKPIMPIMALLALQELTTYFCQRRSCAVTVFCGAV